MTVKCVYNKYQMSYLYAMDKAKLFSICLTLWLKSGVSENSEIYMRMFWRNLRVGHVLHRYEQNKANKQTSFGFQDFQRPDFLPYLVYGAP